jgi:hypothetical protein
MSKNDLYDFERDVKGFPPFNEEKLYEHKQDAEYSSLLQQANYLVEADDSFEETKKQLLDLIEVFNEDIDNLLDGFSSEIKDRFKIIIGD